MTHSRRDFLTKSALLALAYSAFGKQLQAADPAAEPIIDIHQHTKYHGRSNRDLIRHQRALGATKTVLLPAGLYYGLDAQCGRNKSCASLAKHFPGSFTFFANEMPYLREARDVIITWLKQGAIGIGEQKFRVLADSAHLEKIATIAKEFKVPVLLHFWDGDYNMELQRFHKILEKFPTVNFIGHAQTWWGHVDKNYNPKVVYPKGPITPGGLTDRLLSDYPNMYGDLSAHSGLVALTRDEDHTRGFFERHQNQLMFGSDCADTEGRGPNCTGAQILATIRKLAPTKEVERKILFETAKKVLSL